MGVLWHIRVQGQHECGPLRIGNTKANAPKVSRASAKGPGRSSPRLPAPGSAHHKGSPPRGMALPRTSSASHVPVPRAPRPPARRVSSHARQALETRRPVLSCDTRTHENPCHKKLDKAPETSRCAHSRCKPVLQIALGMGIGCRMGTNVTPQIRPFRKTLRSSPWALGQ